MERIDNILVIVDPTASEHPAVDKAATIAAKCGARLELFACETTDSRAMRYAAHLSNTEPSGFLINLRVLLDRLAEPLRKRGIDACIETGAGDPLHRVLLERTQQTNADLVVKDTHHHSLAKRTFITNTDWHLIRGCPAPLLLTKATPWHASPVVLAALDPGHVNDKPIALDHRILGWSRLLADRLGGSVQAVHAFLPVILAAEAASGVPAMMTAFTPQMIEEERTRKLDEVRTLIAPFRVDPAAGVHAELGSASDVLPRTARHVHADILTMGAISRSGLQRMFIGSTAEKVLEHAPCDVLVVKPPDFATDLPF